MNRVIKFRLRVEDKVVGYEKWYEGKWSEERGHWLARPCWLYSKDGAYWNPEYIYHTAKDAFTGLLDKNGKEIYEGDIVRHINGKNYKIVFCGDRFEPEDWDNYGPNGEFGYDWEEFEVIGDIYNNPELLTV